MPTNNRIVLDLNKVQFASFWYQNQEGLIVHTKPRGPTVRGMAVGDEYAFPHCDYPNETMLERARRMDLLDVWTPWVKFDIAANRCVRYCGKKAISMWTTYRAKIYGNSTSTNTR